jgi:hypothetical protein
MNALLTQHVLPKRFVVLTEIVDEISLTALEVFLVPQNDPLNAWMVNA